MNTKVLILTMALSVSTCLVSAQDGNPRPGGQRPPGHESGRGGPDGERGGPGGPAMQRPMNPVLLAHDTNHDGVIDADEIEKASESLKTLDINSDGKITREELRPQRPGGPDRPRGPGEREGQRASRAEGGGPDGPEAEHGGRGGPRGREGEEGERGGPHGRRVAPGGGPEGERNRLDDERGGPARPEGGRGGPGGPQGPGGRHPMHPLLHALDLNHDGTIDTFEIGRASQSLKILDQDGDRRITRDEYRPRHPGGHGRHGGHGGHGSEGHGPRGQGGQGGGGDNRPPHPGSE